MTSQKQKILNTPDKISSVQKSKLQQPKCTITNTITRKQKIKYIEIHGITKQSKLNTPDNISTVLTSKLKQPKCTIIRLIQLSTQLHVNEK